MWTGFELTDQIAPYGFYKQSITTFYLFNNGEIIVALVVGLILNFIIFKSYNLYRRKNKDIQNIKECGFFSK